MSEFQGFPADAFTFLAELREHNDREWFKARQGRYEANVREPARAFVRAMAARLATAAPHLVADDAKVGGSLMRLHRDTRFSRDKTPYKTNVGVHFRHDAGKDVHAPGLYVHLAPDEVFVGAGLWRPDKDDLAAIRGRIVAEPSRWAAAWAAAGPGWERSGERLSRVPRGWDKDHPQGDELRWTSYLAVSHLDEHAAAQPDFDAVVAARLAEVTPVLQFLCEAIGQPW